MLLAKAKVPPWFRPGYRPALRVIMWGRLSRRFRSFLRGHHRQGKLPTYLPAAAYFAERVKFSNMVKSNGTPKCFIIKCVAKARWFSSAWETPWK